MVKKAALAVLLGASFAGLFGCAAGSGGFLYRSWQHVEWHVLGAYKDLVELHREIDRYFFNLDDRNPDRY